MKRGDKTHIGIIPTLDKAQNCTMTKMFIENSYN